jgi:hypothetical protein
MVICYFRRHGRYKYKAQTESNSAAFLTSQILMKPISWDIYLIQTHRK